MVMTGIIHPLRLAFVARLTCLNKLEGLKLRQFWKRVFGVDFGG